MSPFRVGRAITLNVNQPVMAMTYKFNLILLALLSRLLLGCGGGGTNVVENNYDDLVQEQPGDDDSGETEPGNGSDNSGNGSIEAGSDDPVEATPCSSNCILAGSLVLGRPTDSSIAISLITEQSGDAQISYSKVGESSLYYSPLASTTALKPTVFELTGLQASSGYHYQVSFRAEGETKFVQYPAYSFQTQKAKEVSFSFAIHADPHLGIRVRGPEEEEKADESHYAKTLANTLASNVDFVVDLGDTFMSEKNYKRDYYEPADGIDKTEPLRSWVEEDYLRVRGYFAALTHSTPLFLVNGNHEGESGWEKDDPNSIAIWANNLRKEYFPVPTVDSFYSGSSELEAFVGTHDGYYSWQWGDALFIALDPYWYGTEKAKEGTEWHWTLGREQYDWLEQVLSNSSASYKFVFLHNLVGGQNDSHGQGRGGALVAGDWEWGGSDPETGLYEFEQQRPGWGQPIHHVLVQHGVNVVFHGHDHVFVKEEHADGLIYQVVPQPSVLNDEPNKANKRAEESGYDVINGNVAHGAGFIKVTVSGSATEIEYLRTLENSVVADDCTLATCSESAYRYQISANNEVQDSNSNGVPTGSAMVDPADSGYVHSAP